jgi:hypothetical protein
MCVLALRKEVKDDECKYKNNEEKRPSEEGDLWLDLSKLVERDGSLEMRDQRSRSLIGNKHSKKVTVQ